MISFTVFGDPQSGGSKIQGRTNFGRTFLRDTNPKVGAWKRDVKMTAQVAMERHELMTGPIRLEAKFYVQLPRTVKRSYPTVKPDLTKLLRPVEDALTGVVYRDDCQIIKTTMEKHYGEPRVELKVWELA